MTEPHSEGQVPLGGFNGVSSAGEPRISPVPPLPVGKGRERSLLSFLSLWHFRFCTFSTAYLGVPSLALLLSNMVTLGKMTHGLQISTVSSPANQDSQPCY